MRMGKEVGLVSIQTMNTKDRCTIVGGYVPPIYADMIVRGEGNLQEIR